MLSRFVTHDAPPSARAMILRTGREQRRGAKAKKSHAVCGGGGDGKTRRAPAGGGAPRVTPAATTPPAPLETITIEGVDRADATRQNAGATAMPTGAPLAELLYRPDRRLTGQDASGVQAQGSSSARRRLGQLLTSLVSTSVR